MPPTSHARLHMPQTATGDDLDLATRHQIDLKHSALIGDRDTDIEAAQHAGCRGILYAGGSLIPIMQTAIKYVQGTMDHG